VKSITFDPGKLHLVLEAEGGRAISAAHKTIQPAIAMRDAWRPLGKTRSSVMDLMDLMMDFYGF
jgi:hypothetical protein